MVDWLSVSYSILKDFRSLPPTQYMSDWELDSLIVKWENPSPLLGTPLGISLSNIYMDDDWSLDEDLEFLSIGGKSFPPSNIPMLNPNPYSDSTGDMEVSSGNSTWCNEVEEYLRNLIERCVEEADTHNNAKNYWRNIKHSLAIPSIIVSVVMTGITDKTDNWVSRAAFFSNSILGGLSYYYDAGSKMKAHSKARDQYTKLFQEIQQIIALPKDKRGKAKECLDEYSKEFRRILAAAP